jgi:hypothetical protein
MMMHCGSTLMTCSQDTEVRAQRGLDLGRPINK